MIQIVNTSGINVHGMEDNQKQQMRLYEVRVNGLYIVNFVHNRLDGIATCLKKAYEAVEVQGNQDNETN